MGADIGATMAMVNEFKSRKSVTRLTKVRAGSNPRRPCSIMEYKKGLCYETI